MERTVRYDGHADWYEWFNQPSGPFSAVVDEIVRRLLGTGEGRCLDLGCGTGAWLDALRDLGWEPVGIDESEDQLRIARAKAPDVELIRADATTMPFPDGSFAAAISVFTHTDMESFARAAGEVRRVLRSGGRFVYLGTHPCFVGPAQENFKEGEVPRLHPGYRRGGWYRADEAPGISPRGLRAQVGGAFHLPLGDFLNAFAGFRLEHTEEPEDGFEYPKLIALALSKP